MLKVAMLSLHTSPLTLPCTGNAGGMNVYISSLSEKLSMLGVQVDIFTQDKYHKQGSVIILKSGVKVYYLSNLSSAISNKNLIKNIPNLVYEINEKIIFNKILFKKTNLNICFNTSSMLPYDIIHSHYWISGLAGMQLSSIWGIPLVHTMHTTGRVKNIYSSCLEFKESIDRIKSEEKIIQAGVNLIANTKSEARDLRTLYGASKNQITVIPGGVNLRIFFPFDEDRRKRKCLSKHFHVLFAGRIQKIKGLNLLIEAINKVIVYKPSISLKLTIIGSSKNKNADIYLNNLLKKIKLKNNILNIVDSLPSKKLAQWYRKAHLVVVPSYIESFGLVALEAQACGIPVLASNVGGLSEIIIHGQTGILLNKRNPSLWAKAIIYLYENPQTMNIMSNNAILHSQNFDWLKTTKLTLKNYKLVQKCL